MTYIQYILSGIGISTTMILLGRWIINKTFDVGLEKYKSELNHSLEAHKSNLSKLSLEHQTKFNKLFEKRGETIQDIFCKIIDLEYCLINLTSPANNIASAQNVDLENESISELKSFIKQVDRNVIYFPEEAIEKMRNLIKESWDIIFSMRRVRTYTEARINYAKENRQIPELFLKSDDLWSLAESKIKTEFKVCKDELSKEFQKIISV